MYSNYTKLCRRIVPVVEYFASCGIIALQFFVTVLGEQEPQE